MSKISERLECYQTQMSIYAEQYKPKTQADKIRSMSDEELAELFAQYSCEDADYTSLLPIKDCKWGTKQEVIDRNLKMATIRRIITRTELEGDNYEMER